MASSQSSKVLGPFLSNERWLPFLSGASLVRASARSNRPPRDVAVLAETDEPWMLPSIARLLPVREDEFTRFCTGWARRMAPRACVTNSDRKSTRLNSSHANISYAVFCLKKKKIYHWTCTVLHT